VTQACIGRTCPFDQVVIKPDDEVVVCPRCGTAHHRSCWAENGGCTTPGCSEAKSSSRTSAIGEDPLVRDEESLWGDPWNGCNQYICARCAQGLSSKETSWRDAAKSGNPVAMALVGDCLNSRSDTNGAFDWWKKAADAGYPRAKTRLALHYLFDIKDKSEGMKWLREAIVQEDPAALATWIHFGYDDPKSVVDVVAQLAEQGAGGPQMLLAECFLKGKGREANKAEAERWIESAAMSLGPIAFVRYGDELCHRDNYNSTSQWESNYEAAIWYRRAAEAGHSGGMAELATCYFHGWGVDEDKAEAEKWFLKAAHTGGASCLTAFAAQWSIVKDKVKAVHWYRRAAEAGDPQAMRALAEAYARGEGVAQDLALAEHWYIKVTERQGACSADVMGRMYIRDGGGGDARLQAALEGFVHLRESPEDAVKWFRKGAQEGDPRAIADLGWCFFCGHGVAVDHNQAQSLFLEAGEIGGQHYRDELTELYAEDTENLEEPAARWFKQASDSGDREATWQLARCFFEGIGVTTDSSKALSLYEAAADNDPIYQLRLGDAYLADNSSSKNLELGAKWIRVAAETGHPEAMERLGDLYSVGRGVPDDTRESDRWYIRSVDAYVEQSGGDAGFCYARIAERCFSGDGIPPDPSAGIKWLLRAADAGSKSAASDLCWRFFRGDGIIADQVQAKEWWVHLERQALPDGIPPAKRLLFCPKCGGVLHLNGVAFKKWKKFPAGRELSYKCARCSFSATLHSSWRTACAFVEASGMLIFALAIGAFGLASLAVSAGFIINVSSILDRVVAAAFGLMAGGGGALLLACMPQTWRYWVIGPLLAKRLCRKVPFSRKSMATIKDAHERRTDG
jgi:TPR repeat protein